MSACEQFREQREQGLVSPTDRHEVSQGKGEGEQEASIRPLSSMDREL